MKLVTRLAAFVCLAAAVAPCPAQGPSVDATQSLFTVMAAASLATGETGPYTTPLSVQLRKELAGKDIPSLAEIRRFLTLNKADYTKLVSYALVIEGPPDFGFRYREADLPPDAQQMIGFSQLLAAFYNQAGLENFWTKYQPAFEDHSSMYQEAIARVMLEVNGYLRCPTSGFPGRNFSVYIDLLGPPDQVNARSFDHEYYVVVTPSEKPQLAEVRHGYLHYVLEPLAIKNGALLKERDKVLESAQRAPALDRTLKKSFPLLLSECLIRAAEMRMTRGLPDAERMKRAEEAATEGYILTPYFVEALAKFETQAAGIRIYYSTLIEKIDTRREEKKAETIAFRQTAAPRSLSEAALVRRMTEFTDEVERLLAEGEDAAARGDAPAARNAYRMALERTAAPGAAAAAKRSRALYGLALSATQEKQPELAKSFFQQTLETTRDPQILAWAHIYLGRLLDMEKRRDLAVHHYQQALEAGEIAANARKAAQRGLEAPFQKEDPKAAPLPEGAKVQNPQDRP